MLKFLITIIVLIVTITSYANPINFVASTRKEETMDTLKELTINGTKQWIYITGKKQDNPILLVLHGGPGFAMLPLLHEKTPSLENYFTVVNWDQRGSGKSYSKDILKQSITLNQLVDDAHVLTLWLKDTFKVNKIYLLGHSTGSMIGSLLASLYPKDYYAYIGVGQVVNFADNEIGSYDFALKSAQEKNNQTAIKQLTSVGRPDAKGNYRSDEGYDITEHWVEYFGGSLFGRKNIDDIYDLIFYHAIYKNDVKSILKGYDFSQYFFDDKQVHVFNLPELAPKIPIPIYFLSGTHDYETPFDLIQKTYNELPNKEKNFVEFKQSAHFPFYEEPNQFVTVMKKIRDETYA